MGICNVTVRLWAVVGLTDHNLVVRDREFLGHVTAEYIADRDRTGSAYMSSGWQRKARVEGRCGLSSFWVHVYGDSIRLSHSKSPSVWVYTGLAPSRPVIHRFNYDLVIGDWGPCQRNIRARSKYGLAPGLTSCSTRPIHLPPAWSPPRREEP
jgi:hypothetical protein